MDKLILHIEDLDKDKVKSFLLELVDLLKDYEVSANGVFVRNYDPVTQTGDKSIKIINNDLFTGDGDDSPYTRFDLEATL